MPRRPSPQAATTVAQPAGRTLTALRKQAAACTACPLYKNATQTVFGEGSAHARLMLVGETPGNDEDLGGHPFIGPAGRLLDRCLVEAGIDRDAAYVTNVVKHFKWERRGKRRLHQRPSPGEIRACRPWLDAEIALVKPTVLVCLGATATQALLGADQRVTRIRGRPVASDLAPFVMATVHPSALLRAYDDAREAEIKRFVADLRVAAAKLRSGL
jgi:uracil-DNA glycosylase family protein